MAGSRHPQAGKAAANISRKKTDKSAMITRALGFFRNHQQVAVDSLDRLLRSLTSSLMTWAMIAIAIALPLSLLLFLQNLQQFGSDLEEAGQISVFLDINISSERIETIQLDLEQRIGILSARLITADNALLEFRDSSGFGDILDGLDENPLPTVLIVTPVSQQVSEIRSLISSLQAYEGVDSVQYDLEWLRRLYEILNLAQRLTYMLAVLLGVGVALVVGNTIRLVIENRRNEIVVVKLVGGTDAYVARPFLYTGIWYGFGGGLIACVLLLIAQLLLRGPLARLSGLYEGGFEFIGLGISSFFWVLVISGLLGWLGAWLSILRHLRIIEPR
jgi:cell division transport system permease protein